MSLELRIDEEAQKSINKMQGFLIGSFMSAFLTPITSSILMNSFINDYQQIKSTILGGPLYGLALLYGLPFSLLGLIIFGYPVAYFLTRNGFRSLPAFLFGGFFTGFIMFFMISGIFRLLGASPAYKNIYEFISGAFFIAVSSSISAAIYWTFAIREKYTSRMIEIPIFIVIYIFLLFGFSLTIRTLKIVLL